MHGVAQTYGAITFVNALPTGVGAAAAIQLSVHVRATLDPGTAGTVHVVRGTSTPLVERSALAAAQRYLDAPTSVRLEVDSEVPVAQGLKSSSAVSSAVIGAVAQAAGSRPDPREVARLSADVCQQIGVSATGAFDDAFASVAGGAAVTDNTVRNVLRRLEVPAGLTVVLWSPGTPHAPSPLAHARFRTLAREGQSVVDAILSGNPFEAMRRNTLLVEQAMGYRYGDLREAAEAAGAIASGVSGLGPTLAVVAPEEVSGRVRSSLLSAGGSLRTVPFQGPRETPGGEP